MLDALIFVCSSEHWLTAVQQSHTSAEPYHYLNTLLINSESIFIYFPLHMHIWMFFFCSSPISISAASDSFPLLLISSRTICTFLSVVGCLHFISLHVYLLWFCLALLCFFTLAWCVLLSARPQSVFDLDSSVWWVCNHRIHHHTTHHCILYANAILNSCCSRCFNCCLLVFFFSFLCYFSRRRYEVLVFLFHYSFSIFPLRFGITKSPFSVMPSKLRVFYANICTFHENKLFSLFAS